MYVRPREDLLRRHRAGGGRDGEVDPTASPTKDSRLEVSLRETLARDMPRIGLVALVLVVIALATSLRRPRRDVALANVVAAEVAAVLL